MNELTPNDPNLTREHVNEVHQALAREVAVLSARAAGAPKAGLAWQCLRAAKKALAELHDFDLAVSNCAAIYDHVTGGRISKPLTRIEEVAAVADDFRGLLAQEAVEDFAREVWDAWTPVIALIQEHHVGLPGLGDLCHDAQLVVFRSLSSEARVAITEAALEQARERNEASSEASNESGNEASNTSNEASNTSNEASNTSNEASNTSPSGAEDASPGPSREPAAEPAPVRKRAPRRAAAALAALATLGEGAGPLVAGE